MDSLTRMKELITVLNRAAEAYYAQDREIMSNFEYDKLYDELIELETKTGTTLAGSPTVRVGYEAVDELPKETHESPMLSLDKTKDREELAEWLKGKEGLLSWKLDGLTIVLTYDGGQLQKAVTRGNGEVGEVITNNARVFTNLPLTIPFQGKLVLRGEAVITYEDFQKINATIEDAEAKYKNPRNLCSGSVRQLNNEITAARKVRFYAFALVKAEEDGQEKDFENSREAEMIFLVKQGFEVVEYRRVNPDNIVETVGYFEEKTAGFDVPSDGLVLTFEDIAYGKSLGRTSKFPRDSIAFKWADELKETSLLEIEWSPSRTGLINPVAIFEPVDLEGTTVSRASVHNISILKNLKLGIGDTITVYKANMIIPQIAENLTRSGNVEIPSCCPACGGSTQIRETNEVQSLYCTNPECSAKKIKAFTLFVSRDALNIDGLSEATLEKFIGKGFLHDFTDIFHLEKYREEIEEMEGFGKKSCSNLLQSIEKARKTTLPKVIYALGIANIGLANARMICREYRYDLDAMMEADVEGLSRIDGVGEVIAGTFCDYFADQKHRQLVKALLEELDIEIEAVDESTQTLAGKTFAITGSLNHFENRNELKERIEALGGKVAGSVSAKTTALINNDAASNSSKNKKAREVGVAILTEEEFMQKYL
ncbi:MAG: NAD-dependent DNA ligase LigA [Lachnospiraceae bacterium]|nr:NAD-dependent DNA ligase LigA [Lachnospiraceae bacterium]MDY5699585.1 NAD-dependent DNA ligase LigA [Lachnospiraceae bacterium]